MSISEIDSSNKFYDKLKTDTRIHMILIFVIAMVVRLYILFNTYAPHFFAGMNGFNLFNPDSIKNSKFEPNIAITSFQLFYKKVELGKKYKVNRETVKRDLRKLRELKLITRIGSDKSGYWEIIKND